MNICNKPSNKTAPEKSVWTAPVQASGPSPELQGQRSRRNGWSWPPHPLQIVAWLLYLFFAVIGFGVLVPLLPHHWVPAGYAVSLGKWAHAWKMGQWIDGRWSPEAGLRDSGWGRAGMSQSSHPGPHSPLDPSSDRVRDSSAVPWILSANMLQEPAESIKTLKLHADHVQS